MKTVSGTPRRPHEGLGILFALVLALIATVVVLLAPQQNWGPDMWPFYLGTASVVLWVAIDFWGKLRDRPAATDKAPGEMGDLGRSD